jgi:transcription antitermination factor NusG
MMTLLPSRNHREPFAIGCPDLSNDQATQPERSWYAVYTLPQNERSVARNLDARAIESFLPTYESNRLWKNRQRRTIVEALFPTYLFIKIHLAEQAAVLRSPGVRRIVGNHRGPVPLASEEIEFLRSRLDTQNLEPFRELVIGEKVRIRSGPMQGIEGVLIRKNKRLRFVLSLQLINQHAAVDVAADELEPAVA